MDTGLIVFIVGVSAATAVLGYFVGMWREIKRIEDEQEQRRAKQHLDEQRRRDMVCVANEACYKLLWQVLRQSAYKDANTLKHVRYMSEG